MPRNPGAFSFRFDLSDGYSYSVVDWDVFRAPNTPEGRLQLRLKDGQLHVQLGTTVIASRDLPDTWGEVVDWARMVAAVHVGAPRNVESPWGGRL